MTIPLSIAYFITSHGTVSHKGFIVNRKCCPFIPKLFRNSDYILTSSVHRDGHGVLQRFVHVQRLVTVQTITYNEDLPNIKDLRIIALSNNPWLQHANETKQELSRRRAKLVKQLHNLIWDYVMEHQDPMCTCCMCTVFHGKRHPLVWQPMVLSDSAGQTTGGITDLKEKEWGVHNFDSQLVNWVCKGLRCH